jgi:uncharacterized membrane protein
MPLTNGHHKIKPGQNMNQPLHNELKKEFQLERLILFSDAVFAIAITLLVIEIKIPELPEGTHITDAALLKSLGHLIPKFIGFLVSFLLIGLYWTIHHRMFGFVTSYDKKLLVLNLAFLFFIALMPFSNGFYSEYAGGMVRNELLVPLSFYVLNFCGVGFINYFMWRHISNPKRKLTEPPIEPLTLKLAKLRSLTVPFVFLLMLPVAYFTHVLIAVYMPIFIPIILRTLNRRVHKKHKKLVTATA